MAHVPHGAYDGHADRRVRRTRGRLRAALASLLHERPYGDLAVKEVLARADVGRSTFYAHFADKDALLASAIGELLQAPPPHAPPDPTGRADEVLRFSLPVFAHVERHRRAAGATGGVMADPHHRAAVHAHLGRVLVDRVAADLRHLRRAAPHARPGPPGGHDHPPVPPDLLARHIAATFLLVLEWWVERAEPLSAADADERFRALVLPAVRAALG